MNRLTGFVRAAACAVAVVFSCSAEAQTFAELQAAVNAAESGSTVYVDNDMTFDAPLDVPDGGAFTGSAAFTTPTEGRLRWKVSQLTLDDGSGLYLERDRYGLAILFY